MKKLAVKLIELYQENTKNSMPTCRYHPTCSNYAKEAYQTHNFVYASLLSTWRILRCNPLSKGGYDPVPKKKGAHMSYKDIVLSGSDSKEYSIKDFKGQKIILYFYPKDNTPGCTTEAKDFTDLKKEFAQHGYKIIGVSKDSVTSHINFITKQTLDILLLSDPEAKLMSELNVWGEKKNYGKTYFGVIRTTFLLDEDGNITKEYRNVRAKGHAERVLKELQ
jgi:peroxiredoxin Q/BCP